MKYYDMKTKEGKAALSQSPLSADGGLKVAVVAVEEFTDSQMEDLICTAFEGGIGYWAVLLNQGEDWKAAKAALKAEGIGLTLDRIAWRVLAKGGTVSLQDAEDENAEPWGLTAEKLASGISAWEAWGGRGLSEAFADGSLDSDDADAIVQFALFGELVFG